MPNSVCEKEPFTVTNTSISNGATSFEWSYQNSIYQGQTPPSLIFNNAGFYTVILSMEDSCGLSTVSHTILVNQLPVAPVGTYSPICEPDTIQLGESNNQSLSYLWSPSSLVSDSSLSNPIVYLYQNQVYFLEVTDNNTGCKSVKSIALYLECECDDVIPNVFTPNNDGVNDFFIANSNEFCQIEKMKIYNRRGRIVYQNLDAFSWDGKSKGKPVVEGTYYYIVEIQGQIYTGSVLLNR